MQALLRTPRPLLRCTGHFLSLLSHLQCLSNTFLSQGCCVLSQVCHLPDHWVSPTLDRVDGSWAGERAGGEGCALSMVWPQEPFPEARPAAPPQLTGGVKDFSSRRRKGQVYCNSASQRPGARSRSASLQSRPASSGGVAGGPDSEGAALHPRQTLRRVLTT